MVFQILRVGTERILVQRVIRHIQIEEYRLHVLHEVSLRFTEDNDIRSKDLGRDGVIRSGVDLRSRRLDGGSL